MKNTPHNQGFTLIEIIVSIGIFSVISVAAIGALLAVQSSSKRAEATRAIVDNLNLTLDDVVRTVQTGNGYQCASGTSCPSGSASLALTNGTSQIVYSFATLNGKGVLQKMIGSSGSAIPLTDPNVTIDTTKSKFYVLVDPSGNRPTRVIIVLRATIGAGTKYTDTINLQTSVTSRS